MFNKNFLLLFCLMALVLSGCGGVDNDISEVTPQSRNEDGNRPRVRITPDNAVNVSRGILSLAKDSFILFFEALGGLEGLSFASSYVTGEETTILTLDERKEKLRTALSNLDTISSEIKNVKDTLEDLKSNLEQEKNAADCNTNVTHCDELDESIKTINDNLTTINQTSGCYLEASRSQALTSIRATMKTAIDTARNEYAFALLFIQMGQLNISTIGDIIEAEGACPDPE